MAEDLVLYSSAEFGFLVMHDSVSSGSSLMPQKKNPDALELIRGKTGRVFGHLLGMLTVLKSLPLTYNKDLQEDKESLFDAVRTVNSSIGMLQCVLDTMDIREQRMREAASSGHPNATELADYLVAKGMAFREAHHLVGRIVRQASLSGKKLEELLLEDYRSFSPLFDRDLYRWLDLEQAIARRTEMGGTSRTAVAKALRRFRRRIAG
jgi:argininosuccinate lyase